MSGLQFQMVQNLIHAVFRAGRLAPRVSEHEAQNYLAKTLRKAGILPLPHTHMSQQV